MRWPTKDQLITLLPVALFGAAAAVLASAIDVVALRVVLEIIVIVNIAWLGWYVADSAHERETSLQPLATQQVQAISADRRRPTFDRDTGLHAEWYFRLRVEEEIARSKRYGHGLSLLVFTAHSPEILEVARIATKQYLREVDFAGDLGEVIALCLPNTPRDGAEQVVGRLTKLVKQLDVRVAEYPADGETVNTLLGDAEWRVRPLDPTPADEHIAS
ncbi:MAG TPA: hypothetical protein VIH21_02940 [Dehalococcoidia bacterium]